MDELWFWAPPSSVDTSSPADSLASTYLRGLGVSVPSQHAHRLRLLSLDPAALWRGLGSAAQGLVLGSGGSSSSGDAPVPALLAASPELLIMARWVNQAVLGNI
jgi:hypothetical protein